MNEINIANLNILLNITTQLIKAGSYFNNSNIIFSDLSIMIVIRKFYQFSFIEKYIP